jgi:L-ascorbate metabolism protein UlaG (beta-lactamase superfamily)
MATVIGRGPTSDDHMAYLGHATVLLELGGVRLLTDPVLRARLGHLRRQGSTPAPPRDLDAVLISHLHYDHLDLPSLRALKDRPRLVVPKGAGGFLRRRGHSNLTELAPGDSIDLGTARITATRAVHDGRRRPFGGPVATPVGFQIETNGYRAYFAGDTDVFDGMADMRGLDLALLPVWGWGTTLGSGHLDPAGAARVAAILRPRLTVPIHWGTLFPIGMSRRRPELLHDPPREFAAEVAALAPDVEVRIVEPGGSLEL